MEKMNRRPWKMSEIKAHMNLPSKSITRLLDLLSGFFILSLWLISHIHLSVTDVVTFIFCWFSSYYRPKYAITIFLKDMKELLSEKVFVINVLGMHQLLSSYLIFRRYHYVFNHNVYRVSSYNWYWIRLFAGYIAYNFVIGAYSYWGPKAGYSIYNMVRICFI